MRSSQVPRTAPISQAGWLAPLSPEDRGPDFKAPWNRSPEVFLGLNVNSGPFALDSRISLRVRPNRRLEPSPPSTVVDCTLTRPRVIRPGAVSAAVLRESVADLIGDA